MIYILRKGINEGIYIFPSELTQQYSKKGDAPTSTRPFYFSNIKSYYAIQPQQFVKMWMGMWMGMGVESQPGALKTGETPKGDSGLVQPTLMKFRII